MELLFQIINEDFVRIDGNLQTASAVADFMLKLNFLKRFWELQMKSIV